MGEYFFLLFIMCLYFIDSPQGADAAVVTREKTRMKPCMFLLSLESPNQLQFDITLGHILRT